MARSKSFINRLSPNLTQIIQLLILSFILLLAAASCLAQQVEPQAVSSKERTRISQVGAEDAELQQAVTHRNKSVKRRGAGQASAQSPMMAHSYRVEVGETTTAATATMAVTKSTRFILPEKAFNFIFGVDPSNFVINEASEQTEAAGRFEVYVAPKIAGLQTDLWIEMKTATVHVRIETVTPRAGSAGLTDYNSEVIVRLPGYRDELTKLRARVVALERESTASAALMNGKVAAAEARANAAIESGTQKMIQTVFALLASASTDDAKKQKKIKLPTVEANGLRISQASRAFSDPYGRWWVMLRIDATKPKGAAPVIERVEAKDGRIVRAGATLPHALSGGGTETLPIMIDASTLSGDAPRATRPGELRISLSGGGNLTLSLEQ